MELVKTVPVYGATELSIFKDTDREKLASCLFELFTDAVTFFAERHDLGLEHDLALDHSEDPNLDDIEEYFETHLAVGEPFFVVSSLTWEALYVGTTLEEAEEYAREEAEDQRERLRWLAGEMEKIWKKAASIKRKILRLDGEARKAHARLRKLEAVSSPLPFSVLEVVFDGATAEAIANLGARLEADILSVLHPIQRFKGEELQEPCFDACGELIDKHLPYKKPPIA